MLVGEHDHETPLAYAQTLASGISTARLEMIAGAAHLTPSERPDVFNRLVQSFLADPSRQGALE